MTVGPGKYDDICTIARTATRAEGAIVIIFGGSLGGGFSAQLPPELHQQIPAVLRTLAEQIEEDFRAKVPN